MVFVRREEIEEDDDFEKDKKWVEILRAIFFLKKERKRRFPEEYVA